MVVTVVVGVLVECGGGDDGGKGDGGSGDGGDNSNGSFDGLWWW